MGVESASIYQCAAQGLLSTTAPIDKAIEGLDKIIVAIHGIGSQRKGDTTQSVAHQFSLALDDALPIQPLGFFQVENADAKIHISRLEPSKALGKIGFLEVFWADIPREAADRPDTLEEAKRWARTVVSRARAAYRNVENGVLEPEDFELATSVLDELIESIAVIERLLFVADKAGIFKFSIAPILRDYLDDVQVVAEFETYRKRIVSRFHLTMSKIVERFASGTKPELYIVAHSEGTVVSFLGLLEALANKHVEVTKPGRGGELETESLPADWVEHVRGYMTIGSPIDKHLVLWDRLWKGVAGKLKSEPACEPGKVRMVDTDRTIEPIAWRNYYDHGDPVGFKLDGVRRYLDEQSCKAFDFTEKHDFGYSRSLVPAKAHVDYWKDRGVFGHFIHEVVLKTPKATRPETRFGRGVASTSISYLAPFVLQWLALYCLFKAITNVFDHPGVTWHKLGGAWTVTTLAVLLMSVTVAARMPRLVKPGRSVKWPLLSAAVFGLASVAFHFGLSYQVRLALVDQAAWCHSALLPWEAIVERWPSFAASLPVLAGALLVALSGWTLPRRPKWARWALIATGSSLVAVLVAVRLDPANAGEGSLWPLFLGGAMFLYLWWLSILLFDLAFVWHRYIREAVGVDTLLAWRDKKDAVPKGLRDLFGQGGSRAPVMDSRDSAELRSPQPRA